MELYNIKKIILSGNEINKISTAYNPNAKNKDKIAMTVKALEEAVAANVKPCDFDFNRQHETNMAFDELIIKEDTEKTNTSQITGGTAKVYYDMTYNIRLEKDETLNKFYYPNGCLTEVSTSTVFIAGSIKEFNNPEEIEFVESTEATSSDVSVYAYIDSGCVYANLQKEGTYSIDGSFFNTSKGRICFEYSYDLPDHFYKDKECTTHIDEDYYVAWNYSGDDVAYYLKDSVTVYFNQTFEMTFDGSSKLLSEGWDTEYKTHKPMKMFTHNINIPTETIEDVYVSRNLGLYHLSANLSSYDTLNVYAPTLNLSNGFDFSNGDATTNVFIDKINAEETVDDGVSNIHLTSKFFNNAFIDDSSRGDFGYFDDVSTVYVEDNLNTTLTGDALVSKLEYVLCYRSRTGYVELE